MRNASGLRDDYVFGPGIDEPLAKRNAAGVVTYLGTSEARASRRLAERNAAGGIPYLAVDGLGSIVAEVVNDTPICEVFAGRS